VSHRPDTPRAPTPEEVERKKQMKGVLQADLSRLLLWHPFTASLALNLELVPTRDSRVPTAATDGRRVYFDIGFALTLSASERQFVLAHEVWHNAMDHLHRRGQRDCRLWGLAADSEVNALLCQDGLTAPAHAVRFEGMADKSAEQIYAWLRDESGRSSKSRSFDIHDLKTPTDKWGDDWVADPDLVLEPVSGEALRRQWRQHLVSARRVAEQRGVLPAGLVHALDRVLKPKVPWQSVLRQFLRQSQGGQWSWRKPSRRHAWRGAWLPGRSGERLHVVVGVDTSGSTEELAGQFMGELTAIAQEFNQVEMWVLECDAVVHRATLVTEHDAQLWARQAPSQGFMGGGGTDFRPIFERAKQECPQALLIFTDGYGSAPLKPPPWPVLWVLGGDGAHAPVEWGSQVHLATV
jgi:predicted metal-dependent peptidase